MPLHSSPDNISLLLSKMQQGNEEAWTEFHHHFFNFVYHCALQLNRGCEMTANDVAQEAFCRAVKYLNTKLSNENDIRKWLHCLVRTASIDLARGNKRRFDLLEKFSIWKQLEITKTDWLFLADCQVEKTSELLSSLSPKDEQLIRSFYFDGLSYKELAKKLQTTSKAIESKLARIRSQLAHIYQHHES